LSRGSSYLHTIFTRQVFNFVYIYDLNPKAT